MAMAMKYALTWLVVLVLACSMAMVICVWRTVAVKVVL
jgi:hypothetical protein